MAATRKSRTAETADDGAPGGTSGSYCDAAKRHCELPVAIGAFCYRDGDVAGEHRAASFRTISGRGSRGKPAGRAGDAGRSGRFGRAESATAQKAVNRLPGSKGGRGSQSDAVAAATRQ